MDLDAGYLHKSISPGEDNSKPHFICTTTCVEGHCARSIQNDIYLCCGSGLGCLHIDKYSLVYMEYKGSMQATADAHTI